MPQWEIFLEKIVDVIGLVLTDKEAERLIDSLPKNSEITKILRNYSQFIFLSTHAVFSLIISYISKFFFFSLTPPLFQF